MREDGDRDLLRTALRESAEEIGTEEGDIEVLGPLPPVLTRGDVIIYPWVGRIQLPYLFKLNEHEVERILYLPLSRLLEEGVQPVEVDIGMLRVKSIGIRVDNELVWGATAKILDQLVGCFKAFATK
jgi:8-oxo-dGTP pyrophosphatase MutT (NUDIX family)